MLTPLVDEFQKGKTHKRFQNKICPGRCDQDKIDRNQSSKRRHVTQYSIPGIVRNPVRAIVDKLRTLIKQDLRNPLERTKHF